MAVGIVNVNSWLLVLGIFGEMTLLGTVPAPDWVLQLRAAKCAQASAAVQDMYEDLPYPRRDPANDATRRPAELDVPSTPAAISHHIHAGKLDFTKYGRPFRILVAGGGTGDATVMLATTFWLARIPVQIIHVDLSAASIDVARQRVVAHGFHGDGQWHEDVSVLFLQKSIFALNKEEHGMFDFINAVGMIHHLPSPVEGLKTLAQLLQPSGGFFLMVYGELGRTGVYDFQDIWRLTGMSRRDFLNGTIQALLRNLPEGNRLAKNRRMMTQKVQRGDPTTVSDLLVHSCDHAYTVASILELVSDADLQLIDFADPDKYALPQELRALLTHVITRMPDKFQRYHFSELLRGDIFIHSFWAAPQAPDDDPTKLTAKSVLCPYWRFVGYQLKLAEGERERCLRTGPADVSQVGCSLYIDRVKHSMLPCLAVPWLEELNCERSVEDLHNLLQAESTKLGRNNNSKVVSSDLSHSIQLAQKLFDGLSTVGERKIFVVGQPFRFRYLPDREKTVPKVLWEMNWNADQHDEEGEQMSQVGTSSGDQGFQAEL